MGDAGACFGLLQMGVGQMVYKNSFHACNHAAARPVRLWSRAEIPRPALHTTKVMSRVPDALERPDYRNLLAYSGQEIHPFPLPQAFARTEQPTRHPIEPGLRNLKLIH